MKTQPTIEKESYYLVITGQTPKGEKLVAEYNERNNNLRIYVYEGDVIRQAYCDDDNDGKIETYFLNNVPIRRRQPSSSRTRRETLLRFFLPDKFSEKSLEQQFTEKDFDFRYYKDLLHVEQILSGKIMKTQSTVLDELLNSLLKANDSN